MACCCVCCVFCSSPCVVPSLSLALSWHFLCSVACRAVLPFCAHLFPHVMLNYCVFGAFPLGPSSFVPLSSWNWNFALHILLGFSCARPYTGSQHLGACEHTAPRGRDRAGRTFATRSRVGHCGSHGCFPLVWKSIVSRCMVSPCSPNPLRIICSALLWMPLPFSVSGHCGGLRGCGCPLIVLLEHPQGATARASKSEKTRRTP